MKNGSGIILRTFRAGVALAEKKALENAELERYGKAAFLRKNIMGDKTCKAVAVSDAQGVIVAHLVGSQMRRSGIIPVGRGMRSGFSEITTERYGVFYCIKSWGVGFITKDEELARKIYSQGGKNSILKINFLYSAREQGNLFGYPEKSIDYYSAGNGTEYLEQLKKHDVLIEPWIWNTNFVPGIEDGKIFEEKYLRESVECIKRNISEELYYSINYINKINFIQRIL